MRAKELAILAMVFLAAGCRSGVKIEDGELMDTAAPADTDSEMDITETDEDEDDDDDDDEGDEESEEGDEDKPDDEDDKPDDEDSWGFSDCAEDFDPTLPCDGNPEETICVYEDVIWWCQDGVWMNEDDKPE